MAINATIEKICNDCDAGRLSALPLQKLIEYKDVLNEHGNPHPTLPKWETRVPDTLDVLNKIIAEKELQESRESESLSISRYALRISKWALIASAIAIAITAVPLINKINSITNTSSNKTLHNQRVEPTVKTPSNSVNAVSTEVHI